MIIGVPKETKDSEYRVAITPGGVRQLVEAGHQVRVEQGAGDGSGFSDARYQAAGAAIVPTSAEAWSAHLVVKVKEPLPAEYQFLRPELVLFTYLHLAANEQLTREMMARGLTGIGYETVELPNGHLPLLTPMSEVAGRMAVQVGAHYLEKMNGGRGKLLGGVPGVRPGDVVILGAGVAGTNAMHVALGMGAQVTVIDVNLDRLRYLDEVMGGRLVTLSSNPLNIAQAVERADIVVGAVLIKGSKAPKLVTRQMIASMAPGSVVVDIAVDQGGCFETTHATTHSDPVYVMHGVIHYCVANMPGAVPRTSTEEAMRADTSLAQGVNTFRGKITHPGVAGAFGLPHIPLASLLLRARGSSES
jgi:alanine dehydrogenase